MSCFELSQDMFQSDKLRFAGHQISCVSEWVRNFFARASWELYYCNMVEWFWWDSKAWSRRPTGFLQCFERVSLVIWHVKIVPEMTNNVLSGTLSLYVPHCCSVTVTDSMWQCRWCLWQVWWQVGAAAQNWRSTSRCDLRGRQQTRLSGCIKQSQQSDTTVGHWHWQTDQRYRCWTRFISI